jgi:hypothetical protein
VFTLPAGLPSAMVRISGSGAPPDVTLSGPGHISISTAKPPNSHDVVILRVGDTTLIALKHPAGGTWRVTADPSSAPVTDVASAHGLPAPNVNVRVTGSGRVRTLTYALTPAPGRTIAFVERGARTYKQLGVARGAHGAITFSPAPGRAGRRAIVAVISDNGIQMRSLVVGHYFAPRPGPLARPANLRVAHRGGSLRVSWRAVPGAASYAVIVSSSDGERGVHLTKGHTILIGGVPARLSGTVTIQALDPSGARSAAARGAWRSELKLRPPAKRR